MPGKGELRRAPSELTPVNRENRLRCSALVSRQINESLNPLSPTQWVAAKPGRVYHSNAHRNARRNESSGKPSMADMPGSKTNKALGPRASQDQHRNESIEGSP